MSIKVDDTNREDVWNRINEILGNPEGRMYVVDNHTVRKSMLADDLKRVESIFNYRGRELRFEHAGRYCDSGRYHCSYIPEKFIKSVDKLEEGFIDMRVYKSSTFKQSDRITIKIYNYTPVGEQYE